MTDIDTLAATIRERCAEDERLANSAQRHSAAMIAVQARKFEIFEPPYDGSHWTNDYDHVFAREPRGGQPRVMIADCGYSAFGLTPHLARHDPRRVLRDVAAKRRLLDLLLAEKHRVTEDPWYTCPAATRERDGGTYAETDGGGRCTCGRDERVAAYLAVLAEGYGETT